MKYWFLSFVNFQLLTSVNIQSVRITYFRSKKVKINICFKIVIISFSLLPSSIFSSKTKKSTTKKSSRAIMSCSLITKMTCKMRSRKLQKFVFRQYKIRVQVEFGTSTICVHNSLQFLLCNDNSTFISFFFSFFAQSYVISIYLQSKLTTIKNIGTGSRL